MNWNDLAASHAVVALVAFAGCSSERSYPDVLSITELSSTPSSPIVNLTAEDLPQYPPLKELLENWEANNGKIISFDTPYPYEQGLGLVKSLQSRIPGAEWHADNYVPIAYKGTVFLVVTSKVHADG